MKDEIHKQKRANSSVLLRDCVIGSFQSLSAIHKLNSRSYRWLYMNTTYERKRLRRLRRWRFKNSYIRRSRQVHAFHFCRLASSTMTRVLFALSLFSLTPCSAISLTLRLFVKLSLSAILRNCCSIRSPRFAHSGRSQLQTVRFVKTS